MINTKRLSILVLSGLLALALVAGVFALAGRMNAVASVGVPNNTEVLRTGLLKPAAMPVPGSTCNYDIGLQERNCSLYASVGSLTLPDSSSVPTWGFTFTDGAPGELPGPTIVAFVGDTVTINFTNTIPGETVSVMFNGQDLAPDLTGVPTGGSTSYTFEATNPGTFLYEAGVTENGDRQVLMGLFGALVVRPGPLSTQAYADPGSAYDIESLLIFSELDPDFNAATAAGQAYDMYLDYQPRYWLINGKSYPDSEVVSAPAGSSLLLRYINAGADRHSIATLGVDQQVLAIDGGRLMVAASETNPLDPSTKSFVPYSLGVVAEGIPGGQTADVLINLDAGLQDGLVFPLYDASMQHTNNGARLTNGQLGFGGILSFIEVTGGPAPDPGGPIVSAVSVAPSPTTSTTGVEISAQATLVDPGASSVATVSYFVDSLTNGPYSMSFNGSAWTADLSEPPAGLWTSSSHPIYVQATDDLGQAGPISSAVFVLDYEGPEVSGAWLTPNPTNGTRDVTLRGSAIELYTGRQAVTAAHYHFDGGAPIELTLNHTNTIAAALEGLIPAADLAALPEGIHDIEVTALDALGNESLPVPVTLFLDKTGPTASVSVNPAVLDLQNGLPVATVRLEATLSDPLAAGVQSNIDRAEFFVNAAGTTGTGQQMIPIDGLFDSSGETVYFNVPAANFTLLSNGLHDIFVHARDAAGNWGPLATGQIEVIKNPNDNQGPVVSSLVATPNPTGGALSVTLTGEANDVDNLAAVAGAEWYVDPATPLGTGMPMSPADGTFNDSRERLTASVDVSTWAPGLYRIYVRALDASGNWGLPTSVQLDVTANSTTNVFASTFEAGSLAAWSGVSGSSNLDPAAQLSSDGGSTGLKTTIVNGQGATVSKFLAAGEKFAKVSFYFHPFNVNLGTETAAIMEGLGHTGRLFAVELERNTNGSYEVRMDVKTPSGMAQSGWHHINNGANQIEVRWYVRPVAVVQLYLNGVMVEEMPFELSPSVEKLHRIVLGLGAGVTDGMSGSVMYDNFMLLRDGQTFMPVLNDAHPGN